MGKQVCLMNAYNGVKRIALLLILNFTCTFSVHGQQLAPLPIADTLNAREFGLWTTPKFSPDGQWLAYTVKDNRKSKNNPLTLEQFARTGVPGWNPSGGVDIWITNVRSGESRNLTAGSGTNWSPTWSPHGRYIAFLSDRDGSGQAKLWVWQADTNNLRKVSDVNVRAEEIQWHPDERDLVVTVLPETLSPEQYAQLLSHPATSTPETEDTKTPGSTAVLYYSGGPTHDVIGIPQSDPWNLRGHLRDLALVNVDTGVLERIDTGHSIYKYALSPDGSRIAFTNANGFEKPGSQQVLWDLNVISVSDRELRHMATNIRFGYDGSAFSWSPDGTRLAYLSGGPNDMAGDCFVVRLQDGTPRNLTMFPQSRVPHTQHSPPLWDAEGKCIFFNRGGAVWRVDSSDGKPVEFCKITGRRVVELTETSRNLLWRATRGASTVVLTYDDEAKRSGFYQMDLHSGDSTPLLENSQCYTCAIVSEHAFASPNGNELAYFQEDATHDGNLWMTDAGFLHPRQLTHLNSQFEKYRMGAARLVDWLSMDGDHLHGVLVLPAGYKEGKRYPLVAFVYGGAMLSDFLNRFGFFYGRAFNLQLLATRGYAILLPDAPQNLGTPMADLAKTVLPGINKAVELGIADPERLGVMGVSYGGYSTLALIVQTKRFKAAVMEDGTGDLMAAFGTMRKDGSAFGTSITEQGQGLIGGTPWEYRDRYIENSPIFYLDKIETPLLIVHGGEDPTVPPYLGDEVYVGLRRLGKEATYAKYEGEGHEPNFWSYANQLDFCKRVITWFDKHLNAVTRSDE